MSIYSSLRDGIQQIVYKIINPGVVMAVKAGITPNVVTTLGLLGNIAGAALLVYAALSANSDYVLIGWAGVVIILSSIMDMVDGYMARTANMCSVFGAFYDSVLDRYCELVTLSGLAFYFMHFSYPWAAVITFLSLIGSIMVSYVRARAEGLDLECKVGFMQRPERIVVTVLGMLLTGFLDGVVPFDSIWFIIAYDVWNFEYTYSNLPTHSWYCGLALLLAPTFANALWNKGGWIQNRANTLALWCMFAQVFPLFQDASRFTTITSLYSDGFMDPSVRPTSADPTMQGVIAILALAANVICLAFIIKRSIEQKKNPYKNEIFTDQEDFKLAMARAEEA